MYVIEGLDDVDGVPKGSFGVVLKIHHAAIDGMAGVEMITAIHDQTPDAGPPPQPAEPWAPERVPTSAELLSRAAVEQPHAARALRSRDGTGRAWHGTRRRASCGVPAAPRRRPGRLARASTDP